MAAEEQIREQAYTLWEQEGRPEGKNLEHYFRARKMLEDQEGAHVTELPASPATAQLALPPSTPNSGRRRKKRSVK